MQGLIAARLLTANAGSLSTKILAQTNKLELGERFYDKGRFPLSLSPLGAPIRLIEFGLLSHDQYENRVFVNVQWTGKNS
jgi:hypothetical protein